MSAAANPKAIVAGLFLIAPVWGSIATVKAEYASNLHVKEAAARPLGLVSRMPSDC